MVTFEEKDIEIEKIRNFDCKCYTRRKENCVHGTQSCSRNLSPDVQHTNGFFSCRKRVAGHANYWTSRGKQTALTSELTTSTHKIQTKRKRAQTTGGNHVCKNTFLFLHIIGYLMFFHVYTFLYPDLPIVIS